VTIVRHCAGGCGARLTYALESSDEPYAPDLHCLDGNSQYRGGHLCTDCETAVSEALQRRRDHLQFDELPTTVRALALRQAAPPRRGSRRK
jgi:hypothetical protein